MYSGDNTSHSTWQVRCIASLAVSTPIRNAMATSGIVMPDDRNLQMCMLLAYVPITLRQKIHRSAQEHMLDNLLNSDSIAELQ